MKVIFVNSEYPSATDKGGIGKYTYNAANVFCQEGYEVYLLDKENKPRYDILENIRFCTYKREAKIPFILSSILYRFFYKIALHMEYCYGLAEAVQKITSADSKPYLVEVPDYLGEAFFFKKKKIRYISKLHTPTFLLNRLNKTSSFFDLFLRFFEKRSVQNSYAISSPSTSLAKKAVDIFDMKSEVSVIPYPCEETFEELDLSQKEKIVLFVGRDEKRKGTEHLSCITANILKESPFTTIRVAGNFGTKNGSKVDGVEYLGPLNGIELKEQYKKTSILLFLSKWDNFPNVVIEAMSFGVIVCSFDNGGAAEMIEDKKSGFIFRLHHIDSVVKKCASILNNPEKFLDLRKECVNRIKRVTDKSLYIKSTLELNR